MNAQQALNQLSELMAQRDYLALKKAELIKSVIPVEIQAKLDEIELEFSDQAEAVNASIAAQEVEVKQAVIVAGATVKGENLQAVYNKGRESWDGKGLAGYMVAHPEIERFRKVGEPSISIRKI